MGKRGFSPTTFVLVVVLFGALFLVSKTVTPPPAAPPEPPKEQTALPAPANKKPVPMAKDKDDGPMGDRGKMMKEQMLAHMPKKGAKPAQPAFNPNSIDVTPKYWQDSQMGAQGELALQEKVKKAKAALAQQQAAHTPPTPPDKPKPPMPHGSVAPAPMSNR
jgi:hypothetical protein